MIFKDFRDEIKETSTFCNFAPTWNECDDLFNVLITVGAVLLIHLHSWLLKYRETFLAVNLDFIKKKQKKHHRISHN